MNKIDIITIGRMKSGPQKDLSAEYLKRITWPVTVHEVEVKHADSARQKILEGEKILERRPDDCLLIALDERGKSLPSRAFASFLKDNSHERFCFAIGGADGLDTAVIKAARLTLSFGVQTWPHMLARVMLLEQIYRAQQILSGHPYHRD
jgi:23S rRNA (pseudouridine1915-N3)-methyltransferase